MKLGGGIHDGGAQDCADLSPGGGAGTDSGLRLGAEAEEGARLSAAVTANTAAAERLVAAVGQVGEAQWAYGLAWLYVVRSVSWGMKA